MNPLWVGLFEVTGPRSNAMLEGDAGAFLWIAAQAEDAAKLEIRVAYAMNELGLKVVSSEHLQEVVDENELSTEVWELIPEARQNIDSVVCGTWHRFKNFSA